MKTLITTSFKKIFSIVLLLIATNCLAAPVPQITGPTYVCKGQSGIQYCVDPASTGDTYTWLLPTGATGTSNTSCITINLNTKFTGGQICVTIQNSSGSSTICKTLSLVTGKPGKPSLVSTPLYPVCAPSVQTYCVIANPPNANTDTYVWTIYGDGGSNPITIVSGQGTPCFQVNIPANYNNKQVLKVRTQNCKGQSDELKIEVKILPVPNTPGTITGPGSVCKNQLAFYSILPVTNATSYQWSITGNAWPSGGQGTTGFAVDYVTSTTTSALISVTASNACGTSTAMTKSITINPNCRIAEDNLIEATALNETNAENFGLSIYPNPSRGNFTTSFESITNSKVNITIFDITGREMYSETIDVMEGQNTHEFNLSHLPKQIYLLRIYGENINEVKRLIIE